MAAETETEFLTVKPDRSLLDAKFESYVLSLDPLPVLKQPVVGGVEVIDLGEEHYGYLHAHIFGLLNHLVPDNFADECVFYVNESRNIQWCRVAQDGKLSSQRCVWQVPHPESVGNAANASISISSPEWAVVCDGSSNLFLLATPSRSEGEPWQQCYSHKVEGIEAACPSLILHSIYKSFPGNHQMECLICYVTKADNYPAIKSTEVHFVCILEWLTFSCPVGKETSLGWFLKRNRRLLGISAPMYAYFEALTGMLLVASEKAFRVVFDSEKPVVTVNENAKEKVGEDQPPLYFFVQTDEDLCVTFKVETEHRADVSVSIQASSLSVKVKNKTILSESLSKTIDTGNSTWTFASNRLEIFLTKSTEGRWENLFVNGDVRGQEVLDSALVHEVHDRLSHLISESEEVDVNRTNAAFDPRELEDCDLSSYENMLLQRIDGESHQVTHQANLGGYQWLFKVVATNEMLPPFCTRYDVDGLVWQPLTMSEENEAEKFLMQHVATHPALGYVLASKTDRKFITAAPDFSYAVLCDTNRHAYVYKQPKNIPKDSLALRNRKTGLEVDRIAKQHVISLDQCQSILGLHANNDCIFVLSQSCLYAIKVHEHTA